MSKKNHCCECNRILKRDEVALSKKLIDLDSEDFYCIECLAKYLECGCDDLRIKIQELKEQGCTLFM